MTRKPEPNPYNQRKDYHQPDRDFGGTADSLFNGPDPATLSDDNDSQQAPENRGNGGYKKRYDDIKRHYDSQQAEWKQEKAELMALFKAQKTSGDPKVSKPETPEELAEFKKQYPDLYKSVQAVSRSESEGVEAKLAELADRTDKLGQREAALMLRQEHPDYDELRSDDNFHSWAKKQPKQIQDWIYNNPNDYELASRAIAFYKAETGLKSSPKTKSTRGSAADLVSTKTTDTGAKEPKIWTESEISKLTPQQFDQFEAEIDKAVAEGRVRKGV